VNIVAGLGTAAVSGQLQTAYKTNKSIGRVIAHKLRARPLLDLAGSLEIKRIVVVVVVSLDTRMYRAD